MYRWKMAHRDARVAVLHASDVRTFWLVPASPSTHTAQMWNDMIYSPVGQQGVCR